MAHRSPWLCGTILTTPPPRVYDVWLGGWRGFGISNRCPSTILFSAVRRRIATTCTREASHHSPRNDRRRLLHRPHHFWPILHAEGMQVRRLQIGGYSPPVPGMWKPRPCWNTERAAPTPHSATGREARFPGGGGCMAGTVPPPTGVMGHGGMGGGQGGDRGQGGVPIFATKQCPKRGKAAAGVGKGPPAVDGRPQAGMGGAGNPSL